MRYIVCNEPVRVNLTKKTAEERTATWEAIDSDPGLRARQVAPMVYMVWRTPKEA